MKRWLAVLLCCSVLNTSVPAVLSQAEKIYGTFLACAAKAVHTLSHYDESIRTVSENNAPSWIESDIPDYVEEDLPVYTTETWKMLELTFETQTAYTDPFSDVDLDLYLYGCGRQYRIPAFWDGGNTWKVRIACPFVGDWYFETVCTDVRNSALHEQKGLIHCKAYTGALDIYRHGFVGVENGKTYFTYADGTPFFYLGDTHWSLGDETAEMVKTICSKRQAQGFTVFQSEPIGATFQLTNGVSEEDLAGFADYDEKFRLIAEAGLVHANAEFFFPPYMQVLIDQHGGYSEQVTNGAHMLSDQAMRYLEKLSRYWVARYSAYPVIWTLGQEVDDDFYHSDTEHPQWNAANNPYKQVAAYIAKYDAYDHPLSAHQENTGATSCYGNGEGANEKCKVYNRQAHASAFRDVPAHNFYAAQWTPSKTDQSSFCVEKDYWFNSQGKPCVNYEGQYCYLWTKNFGARMQGWTAFLNGFCGAAWGGQDTWSYLNPYDEDNDSFDGVDTITSAEKTSSTWRDALRYPSADQLGMMRDFFEKTQWYTFIPRFDNRAYFVPCPGVRYVYAGTKDLSEIVIYFYSFSDTSIAEKPNASRLASLQAGTLGNLQKNGRYTLQWFNPVTGAYLPSQSFTASLFGTYFLASKPSGADWVLHIQKAL